MAVIQRQSAHNEINMVHGQTKTFHSKLWSPVWFIDNVQSFIDYSWVLELGNKLDCICVVIPITGEDLCWYQFLKYTACWRACSMIAGKVVTGGECCFSLANHRCKCTSQAMTRDLCIWTTPLPMCLVRRTEDTGSGRGLAYYQFLCSF